MFDKVNVGVRILDLTAILPVDPNAITWRNDHRGLAVLVHRSTWNKTAKEALIKLGLEVTDRFGIPQGPAEAKIREAVYASPYDYRPAPRLFLTKRTGAWVRVTEAYNDSSKWVLYFDGRGGGADNQTASKIRFALKEIE